MRRSLLLLNALAVASFSGGLTKFSAGSPAQASAVNDNFTYLDTTKAGKASVDLLTSAVNAKAEKSALDAKADNARMDSLKTSVAAKAEKSELANLQAKVKADSAILAAAAANGLSMATVNANLAGLRDTVAKKKDSAWMVNSLGLLSMKGGQYMGVGTDPNGLNGFESGFSGSAGSNQPWSWAIYQNFGGYSPIQLAGRSCNGCGDAYAMRTKNDVNGDWSPWYALWHSGNLDKNALPYLPIAGGTIAGGVTVTGGITSQGESNFINDTTGAIDPAPGVPYDAKFRKHGIATTHLLVSGSASISGRIVSKGIPASNVADYVFEPSYKLASLSEVEAFAKEHKHLPEVPSAKEIEKGGLDLAQMNLVLLKKVEELTLHAIEQQKAIESQRQEMAQVKAELDALKKR